MSEANWQLKVAGDQCPFDPPRDNVEKMLYEVKQLSISTLFLERIQTYHGHCVLVFDSRHVTRIDELSADEWRNFTSDLMRSEAALVRAFKPDHINVASLGQVVPHLHWHIIPRYLDDPRWGGPIWMTSPEDMPKRLLEESQYELLAETVRREL